jgi:quercetin dioxygenase-like cupin family protein
MMRSTSMLLTFALAAPVLRAQAALTRPDGAHAVPVFEEPRHHPVFQNSLVRVLDVRVPAGETTGYHVHASHHIAVVIAGARAWDQRTGSAAPESASAAIPIGTVFDNASDSIPYTHRVGNADTVGFRYLVAQILAASGSSRSVLPESSGMHLDSERLGARLYRVTLAPGKSTARHRHDAPGLTVQVGDGEVRRDGAAQGAKSAETGRGAWWWRAAGTEHVLRNTGARAVEIVEIDWP